MNKNVWVQPQTAVQQFVANEYVASSCGSGTTYWFECNAGSKGTFANRVYEESNNVPGLQTELGGDTLRSITYHACGDRHKVTKDEKFLTGYVQTWVSDDFLSGHWGEPQEVLIWTNHGTNTHCTTELNPEDWVVARS